MIDIAATFILFFAVIDPIGTIPVFIAVTNKYEEPEQRRIAFKATLISALILVFFVVAGEVVLGAMGVPLAAFQIAGGIILFLFALSMIFGESKPEQELKLTTSGNETAIFPLSVPSIAGPGSILAAVLQTENSRVSTFEQAQVMAVIFVVLLVTLGFMLFATRIHRVIGHGGASLVSRIMGLIIASVAVTSVLSGVKEYFVL